MSIDLEAIKAELETITPGPWESLSAFIFTNRDGNWATDSDESFITDAPSLIVELVTEVERLQAENVNLKTAGDWNLLFDEKLKPFREEIDRLQAQLGSERNNTTAQIAQARQEERRDPKAAAWDKLRADTQTLDTPCRQWVDGLMVDLLDEPTSSPFSRFQMPPAIGWW